MRVLAVDLGATSARVAEVDLDDLAGEPRVLERFEHGPVRAADGTLRWNWEGIVGAVERGLARGLERGPVASIGVDAWGVDYGLLDEKGTLVSPPFSYRDGRTAGWAVVADRLGGARLYERTGIQQIAINTIFQLAAHDRGELARARHLLMIPDLVSHALTGAIAADRTSAGTTSLVDVRTGEWARDLVGALDVRPEILPPIRPAGERLGTWRGVPVHLVAGHDTACAFLGAPSEPDRGTALVSAGTWVIVGTEIRDANTSASARAANFSNEPSALGCFRLLKNVCGFWLLERCRAAWGNPSVAELLAAASNVGEAPTFDVDAPSLEAAGDVADEIRRLAGLDELASRGTVVCSILRSIALAVAAVIDDLSPLVGRPIPEIVVVGGGARIPLFLKLLADATQRPVRSGSAEATALGNAVMQGIALGRFRNLADVHGVLRSRSNDA